MPATVTKVDAHFHLWDRPFPDRPFPWTADPFPLGDMLQIHDAHGVARGVDVTPIMYGTDNGYGLGCAADTGGRIACFGRVDPFAPDPAARLRDWPAAGIRLTFYGPDLELLADPGRLDPFWAACEDLGLRVAVFAPDRLWDVVRAVERHPRLRLVVDHLGLGVYPGCPDPFLGHPALREFAPFEQVLVKMSGLPEISRAGFPYADMHDVLADAVATFGAERLLWGSNWPVATRHGTYEQAYAWLEECAFLDDAQRAELLHGTATRMLDGAA